MAGIFGRTYTQIKSSRNINPGNGIPGNNFSSVGSDINVTMIALEPAIDGLHRFLTEIFLPVGGKNNRFLTGHRVENKSTSHKWPFSNGLF